MGLFSRSQGETVALIDVGARSVAAALAYYKPGEVPVIGYTTRLPIEIQGQEDHAAAMLRALEHLKVRVASEGIPALVRTVGEESIDTAVISIDAPWQETVVHTEKITESKAFTFTKALVAKTLEKLSPAAAGKIYTDVSVVGVSLNGYHVREPFGKQAVTAKIIVLTSQIEEHVVGAIQATLAGIARNKKAVLLAGASLRYQAIRTAFPHEDNALILDATGPLPEVALVRKSFLVATSDTPESLASEVVRPDDFMRGFASIAKQYPLPHTIFLLARAEQTEYLQKTLAQVDYGALWLSDNLPKIIPLVPTHLNGLVRQTSTTAPDLPLLLMALYYRTREPAVS
jgi:hypothetical protein